MRIAAMFAAVALPASLSAGEPAQGKHLMLDAARTCVESYARWHEDTFNRPLAALEWSKPTIESVNRREGKNVGYIAVFFPETDDEGTGFAYFARATEPPDHTGSTPTRLNIVYCGWNISLRHAIAEFKRLANQGHLAYTGRER